MKKLVCLLLTGALIMGTGAPTYAETGSTQPAGNANYNDLKNTNWAYEAVNTMSQKGIVKGYNDGSFKPSNVVTYGEFIKMALVASTGQDVGNASAVNTQTGAKQNWAQSYYNKALELKYFSSTDIKEGQLNNQIPRNDMALIISSILGETKIENYDELQSNLKDVNADVNHDYDIIKSYASGIITGYEDSTFRPDKTLTRAESATVVYRLIDESKRVLPLEKKEDNKKYTLVNTKDYFDPTTVANTSANPDNTGDFTEKAELYKDASIWNLKISNEWKERNGHWNGSFDHTLSGFIYLVKDGKLIAYCQTDPMFGDNGNFLNYFRTAYYTNVKEADYIVSVDCNTKKQDATLVKIIVNPFK